MKCDLDETMAALSCTPAALNAMLNGLPRNWLENNEGPETWSPDDVIPAHKKTRCRSRA
jgi:hypothetical protein